MNAAVSAVPVEDWSAEELLAEMLREYQRRIALVSSFGAESAVVLHMVAGIDKATPVIFLDTGKLFPETLEYRDKLVQRLGLTDLRTARPNPARIAQVDPAGTLWSDDPDICCWQRKVEPLDEALAGFAAWITGRKRYQGGVRRNLPMVETGPDGRVKINPLAGWSVDDIAQYFAEHDLPHHPLEAQGFRSIGCTTCTRPGAAGDDPRAGRWAGFDKAECGIHLPRVAPLPRTLHP
jgi:phosphoadenosine phosphosulfate reductase